MVSEAERAAAQVQAESVQTVQAGSVEPDPLAARELGWAEPESPEQAERAEASVAQVQVPGSQGPGSARQAALGFLAEQAEQESLVEQVLASQGSQEPELESAALVAQAEKARLAGPVALAQADQTDPLVSSVRTHARSRRT